MADPKVIFAVALKSGTTGIILYHNHLTSELDPNREDITLTEKLKQGAKLLDLQILNHLIISKEGFYSFADVGLV